MTIQDDAREQELCNLFNLIWDPMHARAGTDAVLDVSVNGETLRIDFEVKSSTTRSISTARDVGMDHISRWRRKHWIMGFYSSGYGTRARLGYALYLTPADMAPWIDELEGYLRPDVLLARCAPEKLTNADLFQICDEKKVYSVEDARRLFKSQWRKEEYLLHCDLPPEAPSHYSQAAMLEILKLRARYTMERGSTLNNPHIPKRFLDRFSDQRITMDFAQVLRTKLQTLLESS
jgi:hypothetical protein